MSEKPEYKTGKKVPAVIAGKDVNSYMMCAFEPLRFIASDISDEMALEGLATICKSLQDKFTQYQSPVSLAVLAALLQSMAEDAAEEATNQVPISEWEKLISRRQL